jgi:nitroreductase
LGEGWANAAVVFAERGVDMIFRGAPHALIVSAPVDAPCPREDVALALAYFELLAYSAGLGTVWWGMLKMVLETLPELKSLFGLAPGEVYHGMLFGAPAVRYPRTVQRDDAARVVHIRDDEEGGGP